MNTASTTAPATQHTTPRWDEFDAYLFDIDGTLLHCTDAVHYFAFCNTLTTVAGRPLNLDGVTAHGNTDVGILRDALTLAGVPDHVWRPQLPDMRNALCHSVEQGKGDLRAVALPGVTQVLEHLAAKGAVLGVATGNLERIGHAKLQHCNLLHHFQFGGYSDNYEYRADVIRAALLLAQRHTSPTASVCVVGDTPADIAAAKHNGLCVIAVATGVYSLEELAAGNPDFLVSSLTELLAI